MGMFDSMNQAPTPQGQVANGSSFAQKQKPMGQPVNNVAAAAPMGMRPNPMTGARPALGPGRGMGSPRRPPVMSNKPLAPTQLPFNPTPDYNPEAQSNIPSPNAAPAQGVASLYGSTPQTRGNDTASGIMNAYQSQKQQEPQDGSQATLFGGRDLQAPPFQGGGNPSFQNMMQGAEFARPDVMPRGLGPSVVMDENGLEPRRGPR